MMENIRYSTPSPGRTIVNSIKPWAEKILKMSMEINKRARDFNLLEDLNNFYNDYFRINTPFIENDTNNYEENENRGRIHILLTNE